jgi:PhoPQ-activated pathogenicity-related protein
LLYLAFEFKSYFSMKKPLIYWILIFFAASLFQSCKKGSGDNAPDIITPETALKAYLNNGDISFKWELKDQLKGSGVTFYQIQYTSQTWHDIHWTHEIIIMIPDNLVYNNALLVINGGKNDNEVPEMHSLTDGTIQYVGTLASSNKAIIALLYQVPNQPIYGLSEDALISKTLSNYLDDHDFSWPLLFPMVKSAINGMDVIQEFTQEQVEKEITGFVVAGASKRGWTTWLTGASDKRVIAIAPMVIDMLNMPVNIEYQKEVWGDYSNEIQDYVDLGIAQAVGTPAGMELVEMIDPYSYRSSLTMPKMIFMGTNDPYWPVDAVKNYIDDIPGNNRLCYTPNAGHDLGNMTKALSSLNAFFAINNTNSTYPECDYQIEENEGMITLTVNTTSELLVDAMFWSAISVSDQDFRNEIWSSETVNTSNKPQLQVVIEYPADGYKAFFVDLKYKAPFGADYTQSTRVFVADEIRLLL